MPAAISKISPVKMLGFDMPAWGCYVMWGIVLLLGLFIRVDELDNRPMHADEAVQGMKFVELLETRHYEYNPRHYHGPTLYYMTLPVAWIMGVDSRAVLEAWMLRTVPVFFGIILAFCPLFFYRELGGLGCWLASSLLLFSPGLVYYSGYYIQEMLLLAFAGLFLGCVWRFIQLPHWIWATGIGLSGGLMFATKESCILFFLATVCAICAFSLFRWWRGGYPFETSRLSIGQIFIMGSSFTAVSLVFFTSFGANPAGILDAFRSFLLYETGAGHEKEFSYYLKLLSGWNRSIPMIQGEGGLLLACLLGIVGVSWKPRLQAAGLASYCLCFAVTLWFVISLIPYKTPWLVLGIIYPLALLAAMGNELLVSRIKSSGLKIVFGVLLLAVLAISLQEARWSRFAFPSDQRNPYAYVHTSWDLPRLSDRLLDVVEHADEPVVKVMAEEYWPLPWYLRSYSNTGYWNELPENPYSPVMVVSASLAGELDPEIMKEYRFEYRGLRPGIILILYIHRDLPRL